MSHPRYQWWRNSEGMDALVLLGDEVGIGIEWSTGGPGIGVVTDIHGQTFGDGPGDTITIIPAAVTLSTGDRYPVADLVLLRRGDS